MAEVVKLGGGVSPPAATPSASWNHADGLYASGPPGYRKRSGGNTPAIGELHSSASASTTAHRAFTADQRAYGSSPKMQPWCASCAYCSEQTK